ncbi:hypothetical protein LJR289_005807 [Pseudoduganella sp. LjRoot289]|uniref:hypothetical protein n=1 Tax=Pseudoduganella sp. LjRoot289 TaxID=3342314 RepID=UPI003ED08545
MANYPARDGAQQRLATLRLQPTVMYAKAGINCRARPERVHGNSATNTLPGSPEQAATC